MCMPRPDRHACVWKRWCHLQQHVRPRMRVSDGRYSNSFNLVYAITSALVNQRFLSTLSVVSTEFSRFEHITTLDWVKPFNHLTYQRSCYFQQWKIFENTTKRTLVFSVQPRSKNDIQKTYIFNSSIKQHYCNFSGHILTT